MAVVAGGRYLKKYLCLWLTSGWLCTASFATAQTINDPNLQVTELVSGFILPTSMAFIGPDDILVLQKQDGRVRRVIGGVIQAGEVVDVAVDNLSERGLLGIAIHPDFPTQPFVYLYYTESSTGADTSGTPAPLGNRVYRFTWDGTRLVNPTLILDLPVTPGPNHDGGVITFGPDRKLYVVIGDLNRDGQLQNFPNGPPPDDTGVILRLNDDGTIPTDNPFFAQGGNLAKYYAYGIRNSFGMAFDPQTGKLWITENGPTDFDEINLVEPGFNSGWEQIMGPDARDPQGVADLFVVPGSHYADPKFSWLSPVAPTALVFLNSPRLGTSYQNNLFVGDFNNGILYRFKPNAARDGFDFTNPGLADLVADTTAELSELIFGTGFDGITDLKVGPDGRLYILSFILGKIFVVSATRFTLSVTKAGGGSGTVTSSPPGINCGATCSAVFATGTVVTLTATAAAGSVFIGWRGGGCGFSRTCTVTLNADTTVTANFVGIVSVGPPLVAAILPSSRSVQVGTPASAFATIINAGTTTATSVGVSLNSLIPVSFLFQTTDPATNVVTGAPNTPVDIPGGGSQSFVIALTPTAPISPMEVEFIFGGMNAVPVATLTGVNTLFFSASPTPVADMVALAATLNNDGIVNIPGPTGTGVFAVATVNVGASGAITASADTGAASPPVSVALCETNPASGQCVSPIGPSVSTQINANATPTFGIFVTGTGNVPFDPAVNRIFVRFKDGSGVTRGSTSVAVRTQ